MDAKTKTYYKVEFVTNGWNNQPTTETKSFPKLTSAIEFAKKVANGIEPVEIYMVKEEITLLSTH